MKTIRTIKQIVERDEDLPSVPKYEVGDWAEVYCGWYEGHRFRIADVRYNHDGKKFEYLYDAGIMGGWMLEDQIVLMQKAKAA